MLWFGKAASFGARAGILHVGFERYNGCGNYRGGISNGECGREGFEKGNYPRLSQRSR